VTWIGGIDLSAWLYLVLAHLVADFLLQPYELVKLKNRPLGLTIHGSWEPFEFVDLCQAALRDGKNLELCLDVQQAEWELLFDYCYHGAIGDTSRA